MNDCLLVALGGAGVNLAAAVSKSANCRTFGVIRASDPDNGSHLALGRLVRIEDGGRSGELMSEQELSDGVRTIRDLLRAELADSRKVVFAVGLGGELTRIAGEVIGIALGAGASVTVFATLPFGFEGFERRRVADEALASLRCPDVVLCVEDNELLARDLGPDVMMAKVFHAMNDRFLGHWRREVGLN